MGMWDKDPCLKCKTATEPVKDLTDLLTRLTKCKDCGKNREADAIKETEHEN